MKYIKYVIITLFVALLAGCGSTVIHTSDHAVRMYSTTRLGVVPFVNNTETPQAGQRAETIASGIMGATDLGRVMLYKRSNDCRKLMNCSNQLLSTSAMLRWGRRLHLNYVLSGSVNEWRYKVGLDGEPAVSLTVKLLNVKTGRYIWEAAGSQIGGSRSGLGEIGQELMGHLLWRMTDY